MKEQNKNSAAASELNVVPFKTKALPYMIVAPALIITIGIMIPFSNGNLLFTYKLLFQNANIQFCRIKKLDTDSGIERILKSNMGNN